ncbi:MAG: antitoxin family protein [Planctomycetota bacterium]
MSNRTIEAEYAGGVFRPLRPLDLDEGQRVTLTVAEAEQAWDPDRAKAVMRELAAMPLENHADGEDRTSEDHDRFLYPESK